MSLTTKTEILSTVDRARDELAAMAVRVDQEVLSAAASFEGLAKHAGTIMNLTAAIIGCVASEDVTSVLAKVQTLGSATKIFIGKQLQATDGILETIATEGKVLGQLSAVAAVQEGIALQIKLLSVLTNVEVARIGIMGTGFQYLAHELASFANSVIEDTQVLANQIQGRRAAIEETRRTLTQELPLLRTELARIEADLGAALAEMEVSLGQLSSVPVQFRDCVQDIARQIAGIVSAIQSNDITRQMNDHVQQSLAFISSRMRGDVDADSGSSQELPLAYAGITIQTRQLRAIDETVGGWTSQIRACTRDIQRVSTSGVLGLGPTVLDQERRLSSQLANIQQLEYKSQAYTGRIQHSLGGLANLAQSVGEHLKRSRSVRDRLRLLAFNSIIEAGQLGSKAGAVLAISNSIKEISATWSGLTEQSGLAMKEVSGLVKRTNAVMEAFSAASTEHLHEAEGQTRKGLDGLRTAADFAARQANGMTAAVEKMQTKVAEVGRTADSLDACFSRSEAVLSELERLKHRLKADHPGERLGYDAGEVERLFSAFYTTELERNVLRAALAGHALPVSQATMAGNSVELF